MPKKSKSHNPETRARKAEKRAQNIRDYYGPNDEAAERRAMKAERRARNIREYHGLDDDTFFDNSSSDFSAPSSRSSSVGDASESSNSTDDGCATIVIGIIVIAVVLWIFTKIWEGMQSAWGWWQGHSPGTWIILVIIVVVAIGSRSKRSSG